MGRAYHCDECAAIRRELREATAAERARALDDQQDLRAWLERLEDDECARLRETSRMWKAWRKALEHRFRTGHLVLALSESMDSPN